MKPPFERQCGLLATPSGSLIQLTVGPSPERRFLGGSSDIEPSRDTSGTSCSILDKVFHHKIIVKSNETIRKNNEIIRVQCLTLSFLVEKEKASLPRFWSLQPVGSQGVHQFDARVCHSRGPLASKKTTGFRPVKKGRLKNLNRKSDTT